MPLLRTCWTASRGISAAQDLPLYLSAKVQKIARKSQCSNADAVIGWGNKPNTLGAQRFALQHNLPYWRVEDGFIGYLGHPTEQTPRLSLIKDTRGIYYDATQPNDLERLCQRMPHWFTPALDARAAALAAQITEHGLSKYNHLRTALPAWLEALPARSAILLIDQTAGDMSVEYGGGSAAAFSQMITDALAAHPSAPIIVKTHPDVLKGKKQGYLSLADCAHPRVHLLAQDCALKALFGKVSQVYTVTSQLGFEALLYGLPVRCYGMPFYAGWGLTQDEQRCFRRTVKLTLTQLVAAALIKYARYVHPETRELCEVEAVTDWLVLQLSGQAEAVDVCYAVGFSLWKRAFIKPFVGRMAKQVLFINHPSKLPVLIAAQPNAAVLVWGAQQAPWLTALDGKCPVWFIEDGFIRSIGLGADLRRPSSLVIDKQSMYYVPDRPSDIVSILNQISLTEAQQHRAQQLMQAVITHALSKYNVGQSTPVCGVGSDLQVLRSVAKKQDIILVPGQFEQDQSIANSRGAIKTNLALLQQVRQDYPDAFIVYKEHPDLYSGVRPGALGELAAKQVADMYLSDVDIIVLLNLCDRVCTLTSLTGFEALIRHKKVTTYGSPFYAGWGLTDDRLTFPERCKTLNLQQLAYATLVTYPQYVDWTTGRLTSPERVIEQLATARRVAEQTASGVGLHSSWLARLTRKAKYFYEATRF